MSSSSGFSSLLDQFKQTTQRAAAAGAVSSGGAAADAAGRRKRPRLTADPHDASVPQYRPPTTPVRTIYVACPAFAETGGPEALHQLCHMINAGAYPCEDGAGRDEEREALPECDEFGRAVAAAKSGEGAGQKRTVRARMLYLRERGAAGVEHVASPRARSAKYDRYDAPPALDLPGMAPRGPQNDDEYSSELVVWPECWTHLVDSLQPDVDGRKKYQIAIWWLSVNNNKGRFLPAQFAVRKDIQHLCQSAYAWEYVSSKLQKGTAGASSDGGEGPGSNAMVLTEFIPYASPAFAPHGAKETEAVTRDLDVVYNTAKGMHFTDEIIRRACGKASKVDADGSRSGGGIRFNPIGKGAGGRERMTGEEVVALLKRSKVYIDFGPHPGMDRLPREAALAGCIVVTNREGAANYDADVPLPGAFKLRSFDVDEICALLRRCCRNHEEESKKMEPYRQWILEQEKRMELCVDRLVDRVVIRRIKRSRSEKG